MFVKWVPSHHTKNSIRVARALSDNTNCPILTQHVADEVDFESTVATWGLIRSLFVEKIIYTAQTDCTDKDMSFTVPNTLSNT